ncbi:hypothetical protein DUZ99_13785 [Xylanibacillus composti]|uniref:Glycosyl hydrolase-like 10 domain-containing protein n=1 Tax=Xylanibacillus composti TaxID=1572762 RepID=A0A8J4H0R5_9BACL|nr:hypothetical protein [Xylanibacillus composti]MDT9726048.1 hypothetical protein [Xylanibacillus composti]GIQ68807.1 hypothetical protein XYCOK13_16310 [Xylanibacillus composti]
MAGKRWSMFVYPWDLYDEGISRALHRIKAMDIDRILLAVSYHSGKFFLPHNPQKTIYYHDSGSIYFTPDLTSYGVLKPATGEAYRQYMANRQPDEAPDLLQAVLAEAHACGLEVYAWVVGLHNSRLGTQFPMVTVRNAYGESYRHALCPAHEECRHYAVQMIDDLASGYEGLDGIVLESFDYMGLLHGDHHELIAVPEPDRLEALLGLCFCDRCKSGAAERGIDADELQRKVRLAVERIGKCEAPELESTDELLQAYMDMRARFVEALYSSVRETVLSRGKPLPVWSTLWLAEGANPALYGVNTASLSRYVDGWIACYPSNESNVSAFAESVRQQLGDAPFAAGIRMIAPETVSPDQMQRYIRAYQKEDVRDLCFYNYGLASEAVLEQIREG